MFSPTLFNEFRAQYARDQEPGEANTDDPEVNVRQGGQTVLDFGRNFFSPRETTIKRWQVADSRHADPRRATRSKVGVDFNHDEHPELLPRQLRRVATPSTVARRASTAACRTGRASATSRTSPGVGTTGPTTHPDIDRVSRSSPRTSGGADKDLTLTLGLRYDLPEASRSPQVKNPDPQLAAAGHRHELHRRPTRTTSRPRAGLRLDAERQDGRARRLRPLLRPHARPSWSAPPTPTTASTSSDDHLHRRQVPTYPNTLRRAAHRRAAAQADHLRLRQATTRTRGPPGQRRARVRADRRPRVRRELPVRGRPQPAALDRLQRRRRRSPPRSPIQGGGTLPVAAVPHGPALHELRPHRPLREHRRVHLQRPHPRAAQALPRPASRRSLAYTLGKVEDTVPDATAVVPGSGDDAQVRIEPGRLRGRPRPGQRRRPPPRSSSAALGHRATSRTRGGRQGRCSNDWSLSWIASIAERPAVLGAGHQRPEQRRQPLATTSSPAAATATACPRSYTVDCALSRKRIALGEKVKLELIGEAFNLLNSTNIAAQRTASTISRRECWCHRPISGRTPRPPRGCCPLSASCSSPHA